MEDTRLHSPSSVFDLRPPLRPLPSPTVHLKVGLSALPPRACWNLPELRLSAAAGTGLRDESWTGCSLQSGLGGVGDARLLPTTRHFLIGSGGGGGGDSVAPGDLPGDGGHAAWSRS